VFHRPAHIMLRDVDGLTRHYDTPLVFVYFLLLSVACLLLLLLSSAAAVCCCLLLSVLSA